MYRYHSFSFSFGFDDISVLVLTKATVTINYCWHMSPDRVQGNRARGQPKRRWLELDNVTKDCKYHGWGWGDQKVLQFDIMHKWHKQNLYVIIQHNPRP